MNYLGIQEGDDVVLHFTQVGNPKYDAELYGIAKSLGSTFQYVAEVQAALDGDTSLTPSTSIPNPKSKTLEGMIQIDRALTEKGFAIGIDYVLPEEVRPKVAEFMAKGNEVVLAEGPGITRIYTRPQVEMRAAIDTKDEENIRLALSQMGYTELVGVVMTEKEMYDAAREGRTLFALNSVPNNTRTFFEKRHS